MKITIKNTEHFYNSKEELMTIFALYENIKIGTTFIIGNNAIIGHSFTAGDSFKAGDSFTAGHYFTAGDSFTAGDYFKAGDSFEISNHIILLNTYKYIARGYFNKTDKNNYVQLGCYLRTIQEWENDFWNNRDEFPEGSPQGTLRWNAFLLIKNFLESQLK